jgi:general secretion pathway protein F
VAAFNYAVLDSQGQQSKGTIEADSSRQARQLLRDRGLIPLEVQAMVSEDRGTQQRAGRRWTLPVAEVALLTRQLSTLVQSGMPVAEALAAVSQQSEKARTRAVVSSLRAAVQEGRSLASALGDFPRAFPNMYRATVAAGEQSGRLDLVLSRLADYTESAHAAAQRIKLAMIYPVVLMVISLLVVAGLLTYVVPDVVEVFAKSGQELPGMTQALLGMSDFMVSWGWLLLLVLVALPIGLRLALVDPDRRERYHRMLLDLPIVGRLVMASNTSRFAGTLSTLVSSGVPLVEALDISVAVMGNSFLSRLVFEATAQVREGSSLHSALERTRRFPPMMVYMIASGEASGELENMLARVAESQQMELDNRVSTLIGLFEPAVLLFMGGAVMAIVVAMLQPIFNLNQLI